MMFRPTMRLPWDALDEQSCIDHSAPQWNSMVIVGPNKFRDARGNVTLQWTVTVHCEPAPSATPLPEARPIAALHPVELRGMSPRLPDGSSVQSSPIALEAL